MEQGEIFGTGAGVGAGATYSKKVESESESHILKRWSWSYIFSKSQSWKQFFNRLKMKPDILKGLEPVKLHPLKFQLCIVLK